MGIEQELNTKTETGKICLNKDKNLRIDPLVDVPEPVPYCSISGKPTMTAGNFSLVYGKAKSGKTWTLVSIVASLISGTIQINNIKGCLPVNKNKVLYFDTEQSTYHAARTIKRICNLAGLRNPENLFAYGLRPLCPAERLDFIENILLQYSGSTGMIVIDGIRDLLTYGINDEAEATTLTSKFLKWTADYQLHMILVLHQNKNDQNARGHVGTEVVNKAETTISVTNDKKSSLFIISCEDSRDITFDDFGFTIVDGLPVSMEIPQSGQVKSKNPQQIPDEEHLTKLRLIFQKEKKIDRDDFINEVHERFGVGLNKVRDFVSSYLDKGWIIRVREGKNVCYEYQKATF